MGSGKSTVGKALARKISYPFYDADHEIENRCGVDIPTIFEFEGEAGFREREKKMLAELTKLEPVVLATGGGAVLNRTNRKLLRDNGHVIMLSVEIEEQLRRVSLNKKRPLLQGGDVEAKLRKLMEERYALYEKTAHHIVSTNSDRMQRVVAGIYQYLVNQEIILPIIAKSSRSKSTARNTSSRNTGSNKTRGRSKTATSSNKKATSKRTTPKTGQTQSTGKIKTPSDSNAASDNKQAKRSGSTSRAEKQNSSQNSNKTGAESKSANTSRAAGNSKDSGNQRRKRSNVKKKV